MKQLAVVTVLLLGGCLDAAVTRCDDALCPAGTVCHDGPSLCVTPDRLAACDGQPDATPCSYTGVPGGACKDGLCIPEGCGNGVTEEVLGEVCDEGDLQPGDGCSSDCRSDESCGNGVIDGFASEECDDGDDDDLDLCRNDCTVPRCGDGRRDEQFFEACDEGLSNSSAPDAPCRENCQPQRCSDGVQDSGEACDDGNQLSGDGCSFECVSLETCGNGYVDFVTGEECDDADQVDHDGCARCDAEEPDWFAWSVSSPPSRERSAMAYDVARERMILFGGTRGASFGDTWSWDGVAWEELDPPVAPSPRVDHQMAYDHDRGRIVLFGGVRSLEELDDLWEWDGVTWTQRVLPDPPDARSGHAMAYDPIRHELVVFGGYRDGLGTGNDTWTLSGDTWTKRAPLAAPPALEFAKMVWDSEHGEIVLFGGQYPGLPTTTSGETWTWNGSNWFHETPAPDPPGRFFHALVDRSAAGGVMLIGGRVASGPAQSLIWNGATWATAPAAEPTYLIDGVATAFDPRRGQVVMFRPAGDVADTWILDGATWTQRTSSPPGEGNSPTVAFDRARSEIVVYGLGIGNQETWVWDGTWSLRASGGPSGGYGVVIAYDEARERVVLFGGSDGSSTYFDDTFEWDGNSWELRATEGPPARINHAMSFDRVDQRLILHGGAGLSDALNDTWAWTGSGWIELAPSSLFRSQHGMTTEPQSGRVVVFSGDVSDGDEFGGRLPDLMKFDGTAWVPIAAETPLAGRVRGMLLADETSGRLVLAGGRDDFGDPLHDTWEWDGTRWTEIHTDEALPGERLVGAYDPIRRRLFGLSGGPSGLSHTWWYRWETAGLDDDCGFALDLDGDGLSGCDDPDCWGTCAPECPPDASCLAARPRCGDGACAGPETCASCEVDCGACIPCGDSACVSGETTASCPGDC